MASSARSGAPGSIAATWRRRPGHGLAVFDLDARRIRIETRGIGWRRAGWLYYHDGDAFTRRRVPYRVSESWIIEGAPADRAPQVEWNDGGPEPFEHLVAGGD